LKVAVNMPGQDATSLALQADPIRIVPLRLPDELAAPTAGPAAAPELTYRGGQLLSAVKVFTVFWGTQWAQAPQAGLVNQINGFFDFILTSALIDQLAEYSVPNYQIGHGSRIGTATVTSPALRRVAPDGAIQHLLRHEITTNNAFPQPDANTLFFVYLPPGVTAVQGGSRSCSSFCGYHSNVGSQLFYAVMPYPGCHGCTQCHGLWREAMRGAKRSRLLWVMPAGYGAVSGFPVGWVRLLLEEGLSKSPFFARSLCVFLPCRRPSCQCFR
jgi:hypothetical protein